MLTSGRSAALLFAKDNDATPADICKRSHFRRSYSRVLEGNYGYLNSCASSRTTRAPPTAVTVYMMAATISTSFDAVNSWLSDEKW